MKKKWIAMGASVGIAAVMLTVSAMSAMAGTSGYDVWKSAFKQTKAAESISGQIKWTITDNGTERVKANAVFKKNGEGASAAVALKAGEAEHGLNAYLQDGKAIVKPSGSDVYYVTEHGKGTRHDGPPWMRDGAKHASDSEFAAGVERVLDALAGNLKDRVTLEERADGSKLVSLELSGNQVPPVAGAIGSLAVRHATSAEMSWNHVGMDFMLNIPKLTDDIRVEAIRLNATISPNNDIDEESVEIRISGKDEAGNAHNIVVSADIDLYDVNATTPDTVDLNGKQVETKTFDADWHHGHGGR
mgnify:CR=1 FL=1